MKHKPPTSVFPIDHGVLLKDDNRKVESSVLMWDELLLLQMIYLPASP